MQIKILADNWETRIEKMQIYYFNLPFYLKIFGAKLTYFIFVKITNSETVSLLRRHIIE